MDSYEGVNFNYRNDGDYQDIITFSFGSSEPLPDDFYVALIEFLGTTDALSTRWADPLYENIVKWERRTITPQS